MKNCCENWCERRLNWCPVFQNHISRGMTQNGYAYQASCNTAWSDDSKDSPPICCQLLKTKKTCWCRCVRTSGRRLCAQGSVIFTHIDGYDCRVHQCLCRRTLIAKVFHFRSCHFSRSWSSSYTVNPPWFLNVLCQPQRFSDADCVYEEVLSVGLV